MTTGARIFVAGSITLAVAAVVIAIQHARLVNTSQRVDDLARDVRDRTAERDAARRDVKVVTEYVDRVRVVRETGDIIIKGIPVYVDREADRACVVPVGFVRVHDAAAANMPVGDPGRADAAAAGVALSAVAATVAGNYTTCHENTEQLIALQTRVRDTEEPMPRISRTAFARHSPPPCPSSRAIPTGCTSSSNTGRLPSPQQSRCRSNMRTRSTSS